MSLESRKERALEQKACTGRRSERGPTGRNDEVSHDEWALIRVESLVYFIERLLHLRHTHSKVSDTVRPFFLLRITHLDRITRSPVDIEELSVRPTPSTRRCKLRY